MTPLLNTTTLPLLNSVEIMECIDLTELNLTTGIPTLDKEHQLLFDSLTRLQRFCHDDVSLQDREVAFSKIRDLARDHFETEERLMTQTGYETFMLQAHLAEHHQFMEEINKLEHALRLETIPKLKSAQAHVFLVSWWGNHISNHDKPLTEHVQQFNTSHRMYWWSALFSRMRPLLERVLGQPSHDLRGLLAPWWQSSLIRAQRAGLIISRVRLLAALFAILTPSWIVIDYIFLPPEIAFHLAVGRLVTSLGFYGLFRFFRETDQISHAYLAATSLFLLPSLFFVFTNHLFANSPHDITGFAANLVTGYAFLPFIMAAGISVFPLSALEGILFALPGLVAEITTGHFSLSFQYDPSNIGFLWLLFLIAGVAILAGMSQLHLWGEIVSKASRDQLTQLYNRATGRELLEKYYLMALRNKTPLALLFFDLDNFKSVNDTYGHEEGDRTLQTMSSALRRGTRQMDLAIRWGGEEFLVLLPLKHVDDTHTLLNRLCRPNGLGTRPDGKPITASVGMAEMTTDRPTCLSSFVALADQRMYRAKQTGKNRICFGDEDAAMTATGTFG
jgi:diguanylate cyclase (GGDEF)-like protein/hemerythrin-like metal-binding protein